VDPSSPGAAAAWQQLAQDNPSLEANLGSSFATLVAKGVKFLSIEPNSQAEVGRSDVVVAVEPEPGIRDSDVTQSTDQIVSAAEKAGATQVATRIVTLDAHQALQVSYSLTLKDQLGNNQTAPGTQYELGANDFLYVITLTGTSPDLSTIATTFHTQ
jgi:hypothetical protein